MTVIVHYGAGNLKSVARALERLGENSTISSDPKVIARAKRLILPGVGSFDTAMNTLRDKEIIPVLEERVLSAGVPILGICLGLQLFTERSEEGSSPGLSWIAGHTQRFRSPDPTMKVPHIGWNTIERQRDGQLFDGFPSEASLYFVHSYYVVCADEEVVTGRSDYGERFVCAIEKGNILGVQFHPEKSQQIGLHLLHNFLTATS
ncbi:imidazole glycerol phosphate synthase subunit HisH [bacterium]|nr:imidazole glycerol phosphate synthase subunit HisH [bacterium]